MKQFEILYLEAIWLVTVVSTVIPRVYVVIPLQMCPRLIELLTELTKGNVCHFFVVVM